MNDAAPKKNYRFIRSTCTCGVVIESDEPVGKCPRCNASLKVKNPVAVPEDQVPEAVVDVEAAV